MSSVSADSAKILHIVGSPKGEVSASTQLAQAFLAGCGYRSGSRGVTTLAVFSADLPRFGGELAFAKLAPMLGEARSAEQEAAWHSVLQVVADFDRHEKIVISTPMWNFGLPWALKAYVDLLVQPGVSFGLDDSFEHIGLLRDRPVQLIITRSSALPEDSKEDFLLPYLRHILGFIGLRDVRSLVVEGTTLPAEARAEFLAAQAERAREAAAGF